MIASVAEYLDAIKNLSLPNNSFSSTTMPWYRGQGNLDWDLVPSIYRGSWDHNREREINRDFQLRALADLDIRPTTDVSWLFIMRHYGAPTRLLDWSESKLAALYFAVHNYDDKSDAAVWAFHPWKLNEHKESIGEKSVHILSDTVLDGYSMPRHNYDIDNPSKKFGVKKTLPMALRPARTTRRILAQHGHFTIHGSRCEGLNTMPEVKDHFKKILINGQFKTKIMQELYELGVSHHTMFPNLDGLAKEIAMRYSNEFMR